MSCSSTSSLSSTFSDISYSKTNAFFFPHTKSPELLHLIDDADSSFSSRLPTPPPPPLLHREDTLVPPSALDEHLHPGSIISIPTACSSPFPSPVASAFNNNNNTRAFETSPFLDPQFDNEPSHSPLRLLKPLGHGAFSSVWLGQDLGRFPLTLLSKRCVRDLRRRASGRSNNRRSKDEPAIDPFPPSTEDISTHPFISPAHSPFSSNAALPFKTESTLSRDSSLRKFRERLRGTRPAFRLARTYLDETDGEMGQPKSPESSLRIEKPTTERLLAVKVTPRRVTRDKEEEERTRVRFVREVEVLKHISHPNITPLLTHLSTQHHHILVLPFLPGGDLLGLVNSDVAWGKLCESVLRRMWCELCKAVGWMHGVGLVHRDIKLENILLTSTLFTNLTPTSPIPSPTLLPPTQTPLIKLTDFGLSRFVEISTTTTGGETAELLTTRCGSEAYAAPELVTGGQAGYDARKTDAWACGVVLYALVGRKLPFGDGWSGGDRGAVDDGEEEEEEKRIRRGGGAPTRGTKLTARRQWLMKIARGEWVWPGDDDDHGKEEGKEEAELVGPRLIRSKGARRMVDKLLVRDPRKRARIVDLWEDEWMLGWKEHGEDGGGLGVSFPNSSPPVQTGYALPVIQPYPDPDREEEEPQIQNHPEFYPYRPTSSKWVFGGGEAEPNDDDKAEGDEDNDEEEGGCLFDQEGIDSITRQEVV